MDGCKYNPEKSSTTKVGEHIPLGFSMSTTSSFKEIKKACCMQRFHETVLAKARNENK